MDYFFLLRRAPSSPPHPPSCTVVLDCILDIVKSVLGTLGPVSHHLTLVLSLQHVAGLLAPSLTCWWWLDAVRLLPACPAQGGQGGTSTLGCVSPAGPERADRGPLGPQRPSPSPAVSCAAWGTQDVQAEQEPSRALPRCQPRGRGGVGAVRPPLPCVRVRLRDARRQEECCVRPPCSGNTCLSSECRGRPSFSHGKADGSPREACASVSSLGLFGAGGDQGLLPPATLHGLSPRGPTLQR